MHWQAAGYYASRCLQTSWLDFQAGYAAAKAETAAAVAAERERCLRIVESVDNYSNPMTANDCADAIRAGEKEGTPCCSNPIKNAWGQDVDTTKLNAAHAFASRVLAGQEAHQPAAQHADDVAVDALAALLKAKLAKQRAKGYSGWDTDCTQQRLSNLLRAHVEKGDPVDVANFCAFLSARGEGIATQPAAQQGEPFGYFRAEPFGWTDCAEGDEGAVALYEKAGATDATLHKIIASVEAALDAAGAPAGTLVDRIGALAEDAARWRFSVADGGNQRMSWLDVYDEWDGDGDFTAAIDAARAQQEAG